MALDFLGSIGNIAGTINQIAGPVGQIIGALRGNKPSSYAPSLRDQIVKRSVNRQPSQAENQALSLLMALGQPNNSYVKSIQDEEFKNLHSGVQGDIRSKVLADRRERSMGRSNTFFDPERSDENIAYQISRGTPMLRQQAHKNAIERILEAAGIGEYAANADTREQNSLNSMASLYALDTLQPNMGGGGQMQSQAPGLLGRIQGGLGGLDQILKIFQKTQKPEMFGPYRPQDIRWNQMRYNA